MLDRQGKCTRVRADGVGVHMHSLKLLRSTLAYSKCDETKRTARDPNLIAKDCLLYYDHPKGFSHIRCHSFNRGECYNQQPTHVWASDPLPAPSVGCHLFLSKDSTLYPSISTQVSEPKKSSHGRRARERDRNGGFYPGPNGECHRSRVYIASNSQVHHLA